MLIRDKFSRFRKASVILLSLTGCSASHNVTFSEIRQVPSPEKLQKFVESSHFQSQKKPNIYLVFFDTLRPDSALSRNRAMRRFYDDNLKFEKSYASGTATWYSMFSLFHSNPSFLAYDLYPRSLPNTDEYGSIYLKILKKIGYTIDIYGYGWSCVGKEIHSGTSWNRLLISYFGWKSRVLDRCKTDLEYDEKFYGNQDEVTLAELKKKLPSTVKSSEGHFSLLTFFNNHNPYKWGGTNQGISHDIGPREDFSNQRTTINRYNNSVRASDAIFSELIRFLNTLPGSQNSVVVLFSDHGEMLFEKNRKALHGGAPDQKKIEILLAMQLPGASISKMGEGIASISDIFPTLFDYLNISPTLDSSWKTGISLISATRDSTVVTQSNQQDPTRNMVLVNATTKVWIHVPDEDFYHSKSIKVTATTDLEDNPKEDICKDKSAEECKNILETQFSDALRELYPSTDKTRSRTSMPLLRAPARVPEGKK